MTMEELIDILKDSGASEDIVIRPEHNLKEDLQMTSLATVLLLVNIEQKLNCTVEPELFIEVKTVQDLYDRLKAMI